MAKKCIHFSKRQMHILCHRQLNCMLIMAFSVASVWKLHTTAIQVGKEYYHFIPFREPSAWIFLFLKIWHANADNSKSMMYFISRTADPYGNNFLVNNIHGMIQLTDRVQPLFRDHCDSWNIGCFKMKKRDAFMKLVPCYELSSQAIMIEEL